MQFNAAGFKPTTKKSKYWAPCRIEIFCSAVINFIGHNCKCSAPVHPPFISFTESYLIVVYCSLSTAHCSLFIDHCSLAPLFSPINFFIFSPILAGSTRSNRTAWHPLNLASAVNFCANAGRNASNSRKSGSKNSERR